MRLQAMLIAPGIMLYRIVWKVLRPKPYGGERQHRK